MTSYQALFAIGEGFDAFVSHGLPAEIAAVRRAQGQLSDENALSDETRRRLEALESRYHLLAAGEMWCPDCQLNLTAIDHLQRLQPRVALAIVSKGRAEHGLRERLNLSRIPIPLVVVLDESFEPIGRFVEQPQAVIDGGEASKADYRAGHYLESTVKDLLTIIETHEKRKRA